MKRPRLWIRTGTSRHVVITNRWAFKIPILKWGVKGVLRGCLANMSEQEWSGYQDPDLVVPLNRVVRALPAGLCNVYRRALPYTDDFDPDRDRHMFGMFGDAKASNLGMVDGHPVIIDYDMYCSCWQQCTEHGIHVSRPFQLLGKARSWALADDVDPDTIKIVTDMIDDWEFDRTLSHREIAAIITVTYAYAAAKLVPVT